MRGRVTWPTIAKSVRCMEREVYKMVEEYDNAGMVGLTRYGYRYLNTEKGDKEKWSAGDGEKGRRVRSTTVLCVRKGEEVVMLADGQVTMGGSILKPNVKKTRKIGDKVMGGFAGTTADAFTLFERLETKLEEHPSQLTRAAVELAKMWRMDKYLRRLDASLIVADKNMSLQITGNGDVLEPHDGVISIGSGSPYALAAARALIEIPELDALEIAKRSMRIAADACIYTNTNFSALRIGSSGEVEELEL